jgi:hypothetical protein
MRNRKLNSLIWGGLLVALGILLLIDNLDLLGDWNAPIWSLVLAALSLVFLATYFSDREQWWALIPGLVILGIAVAVFLAEQDLVADYVVATIILAGVGVPFFLIYLSDRQHWWALIPAFTMTGVATGVLLEGVGAISGTAVAGFVFAGISGGFGAIYLIDRHQWWALIPGGIMGVMAFGFLLAAATEYVLPIALILLGLFLLRSNLIGGLRQSRSASLSTEPIPSITTEELDRSTQATPSKQKRSPTLEEQIRAAIAEEEIVSGDEPDRSGAKADDEQLGSDETEAPTEMPPAPEMPEPPDMPSGPQVG